MSDHTDQTLQLEHPTRRSFLGLSSVALATAAFAGLTAHAQEKTSTQNKDKPLPRLLYSHQIQLFDIAPVHQPLAFRFAQCVGSGPLSKIHQFVEAALFANGISHHK
jgi:hypothetical protein